MKEPLIIFSPQGMLGYGYPLSSFERALSFNPHMIGVDAGSTDAGPYRLGSGKPTVSKEAVKKDLTPMVRSCLARKIPIIVGSAGGAGARPHVDWVLDILWEILKEERAKPQVIVVYSDVAKGWLKKKLFQNKVKPLGPVNQLKEEEIERANHIVAVMGIQPYLKALEMGAEIIITGRSNDPAIFASYAVMMGTGWGQAFHAGKILECGAIAAVPGTASDGMLAFLFKDHFFVEPANPKRICTPLSVAAHSLYEKEHPYLIPGPEGILNIQEAQFYSVSDRRVKVEGSSFEKAKELWIKLEGAKEVGYRCISIAFVKDPLMIQAKQEWVEATVEATESYFERKVKLLIHARGKGEMTVIIEAVAPEEELAKAACSWARSYLMHYHYRGRKATSGNLAIPFSPSDITVGLAYEFNIHHLVKIDENEDIFEIATC